MNAHPPGVPAPSFLRSLVGSRFWITSYVALIAGFIVPVADAPMRAAVPVVLGGILFFSCLRLPLSELVAGGRDPGLWRQVGWMVPAKLLAIPLAAWAMALLVVPDWAPGVLLVSLMPAGLSSIAFTDLYRGHRPLALALVVATSLAAPLSVPGMLGVLGHGGAGIPLAALAERALYILLLLGIPFTLAQAVRSAAPAFASRHHGAWSGCAIACSCTLVFVAVVACRPAWQGMDWRAMLPGLAGACLGSLAAGLGALAVAWRLPADRATAFAIGALYMNNGLSVAFAVRFFPDQAHVILPCILMQFPMVGATALAGRLLARRH